MGKLHPHLPSHTIPWIKSQHMFWVASAPLSGSGHVNVSPKVNEGTFHIVDKSRVWYEDLTGSGVETISHLREPDNGRISILFHAFEGSPTIVRIYGTGTVYEYGTPEYDTFLSSVQDTDSSEALVEKEEVLRRPGSRAVILVDILQVMTTCGWSVPYYEFKSYRTKLHDWAENLESHDAPLSVPTTASLSSLASTSTSHHPDDHLKLKPLTSDSQPTQNLAELLPKGSIKAWWHTRNSHSIDGLPGLLGAFGVDGMLFSTRNYPGQATTTTTSNRVIDNGDSKKRISERGGDSFVFGLISGLGLGLGIGASVVALAVGRTRRLL